MKAQQCQSAGSNYCERVLLHLRSAPKEESVQRPEVGPPQPHGQASSVPASLTSDSYPRHGRQQVDHSIPQRHVVRPRWRAHHWTGDAMSLARCVTHHVRQPRHPEMATFEQIAATSQILAQKNSPKQGRHHDISCRQHEATPKPSMRACISKPFGACMIQVKMSKHVEREPAEARWKRQLEVTGTQQKPLRQCHGAPSCRERLVIQGGVRCKQCYLFAKLHTFYCGSAGQGQTSQLWQPAPSAKASCTAAACGGRQSGEQPRCDL